MKISIWSGPAYEPWGPPSLDAGGIGGSETACIHMARALASLGNEVSVFGEHEGFEGEHNGVNYIGYKRALADRNLLAGDVFVSSRDKAAIRLEPNVTYRVLWVHDIHCGDDWEKEILKYDKILCLSSFAKKIFLSYYPHMQPHLEEKISLTRNGIDTRRYEIVGPTKKPGKFFYSSSPDRGLDVLLNMWPQIRKIRDDAELDIYYGFDTWLKMAKLHKSKASLIQIAFFTEKMKSLAKEGVNYHGRVGQAELARAQLASSMWLYPTSFKETSCITAMEAQAAGAVPLTTRLGALDETVRHGILLDPPATGAAYQEAFLGTLKGLLGPSEELRLTKSMRGRRWALDSCSWREVAVEWHRDFEDTLRKMRQ